MSCSLALISREALYSHAYQKDGLDRVLCAELKHKSISPPTIARDMVQLKKRPPVARKNPTTTTTSDDGETSSSSDFSFGFRLTAEALKQHTEEQKFFHEQANPAKKQSSPRKVDDGFSMASNNDRIEESHEEDDDSGTSQVKFLRLQATLESLERERAALATKLAQTKSESQAKQGQLDTVSMTLAEARNSKSNAASSKSPRLGDSPLIKGRQLREKGRQLLKVGDCQAAKMEFRRAVHFVQDDYLTWIYLAKAFFQLDELEEAHDACELSLELHVTVAGYTLLGRILQQLGSPDEAIHFFQLSLELKDERKANGLATNSAISDSFHSSTSSEELLRRSTRPQSSRQRQQKKTSSTTHAGKKNKSLLRGEIVEATWAVL